MGKGNSFGVASLMTVNIILMSTVLLLMYVKRKPENTHPSLVVVKATQGSIIGDGIPEGALFRGIPFSQPPTGYYRFRSPRDPVAFPNGFWNATYYRPKCLQTCIFQHDLLCTTPSTNEDCLYLNVWVPNSALSDVTGGDVINHPHKVIDEKMLKNESDLLAVMVYIHGGSFLQGSGNEKAWESRHLADAGNVIVVTLNYRLGILGFLVHGDEDDSSDGNFGIEDIMKCLEWVQKNIKYFGGNPNKVTVFGESSGGEAVQIMMTIPEAEGLFQQAIMQSAPLGLPLRSKNQAIKYGNKFVESINCQLNDMDCLRNKTGMEVLMAMGALANYQQGNFFHRFQPLAPVVNTTLLPKIPREMFLEGKGMDIPVLMGTVNDESVFFVADIYPQPVPDPLYIGSLNMVLGSKIAPDLVKQYPPACGSLPPTSCDNRDTMFDILDLYTFLCPQRQVASIMPRQKTWIYNFNETWPSGGTWATGFGDLCDGNSYICHTSEILYLFTVKSKNTKDHSYSNEIKDLSDRIRKYWTNFAKYGNPNGNIKNDQDSANDLTHWPTFSTDKNDDYAILDLQFTEDTVLKNHFKEECDFFDGLDSYLIN